VSDDTRQTKLEDFDQSDDSRPQIQPVSPPAERRTRAKVHLWQNTRQEGEEWCVCNFDGTVFLAQLIDGEIHAYGMKAVCRWCGDDLVVREDKVFCNGRCGRYQGQFSLDPNMYLQWEGAKSYTLRKEIAEVEGLQLEPRDLEPIQYAPNWSVFDEYDEDQQ
jgi:hypothetical protein